MSGHMYIAWCPYGRHKVDTWWKHRLHMDIRVVIFIVSMDHKNFV